MKGLYFGLTLAVCFFAFFFVSENNFTKSYDKRKEVIEDSLNSKALTQVNNEVMRSLEQKVENMEKYIDASNKNLDAWLKVLASFLTIVIAASIFNGLRTHDKAKEELDKIKAISEDIKTLSKNAKTKLKKIKEVTDQLDELTRKASYAESYIAGELEAEKQETIEPSQKVETKSEIEKNITKTDEPEGSTNTELIKRIETMSASEMATVLIELQKSKFKNRSIDGLKKKTKLPESNVKNIIEAFVLAKIVDEVVWYGKTLYRLTEKGKGLTIME